MVSFAEIQYCIYNDKVANFAEIQYYIYADIVGGSEKVPTHADVIYGWYLVVLSRKDSRSTLVNSSRRSLSELDRFLFCIEALMARFSSANV